MKNKALGILALIFLLFAAFTIGRFISHDHSPPLQVERMTFVISSSEDVEGILKVLEKFVYEERE